MKGSWVTSLAVGGVLLLLTLFLGLQYNWLGQASEAERERMQKRVETDTKNFADDFNREIQAAYFNFQTGAASWERGDWTEFNERYDYWKSKTQYAELIREFVYFGKGKEPLRYDSQTRSFTVGEIRPELSALKQTIEGGANFRSFYEDAYALVMPIHEPEKQFERIMLRRTASAKPPAMHMPERHGFLVIALERSVIADRILPELVSKHFPENNFRVEVKNKAEGAVYETAGTVAQPDAKAGMLSLSPDSMIFFGDRSVWSQLKSEKRQDIVVSERTESTTFSHTETSPDGNKTGTFTIQLQPKKPAGPVGKAKTRTSVVATSGDGADPWTLNVQHVAGSIDAYVNNQRNKSFAIGLGVYLLLVGAIVAIVLSALRSKRFAQQQIDFVSSVSHEFRTPLAVIYSASENLADGVTKDREQVTRYGNLIKGEGKKLSSMVEQILEFAVLIANTDVRFS